MTFGEKIQKLRKLAYLKRNLLTSWEYQDKQSVNGSVIVDTPKLKKLSE